MRQWDSGAKVRCACMTPRAGGRCTPSPRPRGGSAVTFSPDGRRLALAFEHGAIELWDLPDGLAPGPVN